MSLLFAFTMICGSVFGQLTPELNDISELDSETFATFTACERPVVVDFYTQACAPCQIMERRLETWVESPTFPRRLRIGKVNCASEVGIAKRFQIGAYPTLCVFKQGKVTRRMVGVQSIENLREATACEGVHGF